MKCGVPELLPLGDTGRYWPAYHFLLSFSRISQFLYRVQFKSRGFSQEIASSLFLVSLLLLGLICMSQL